MDSTFFVTRFDWFRRCELSIENCIQSFSANKIVEKLSICKIKKTSK